MDLRIIATLCEIAAFGILCAVILRHGILIRRLQSQIKFMDMVVTSMGKILKEQEGVQRCESTTAAAGGQP